MTCGELTGMTCVYNDKCPFSENVVITFSGWVLQYVVVILYYMHITHCQYNKNLSIKQNILNT